MRTLDTLKAFAGKALNRAAGLAVGAVASLGLLAGAAQAEPALWVIRDADSTIYLFGSVHLLKADAHWMTPKIQKALDDSQDLTLEIADIDNQAAMLPIVQKYGLDPEHPLSTKLNEADNAKLAKGYADLGLQPKAFDIMQPWLAGLTFTVLPLQKAGFDPKSGVELTIKAKADARHEPVLGFETTEQQIKYFATMSQDQQIAFLREALDDAPNTAADLDKVEHAWEAGDVDAIAEVMNSGMKQNAPALYELLLVSRNKNFADQIAEKLKGKGVSFIAVGAAHLAGPDSVQAQLKKKGIKVERF
jgi:uncharacterized protein YbaP (TraB family)